MTRRTAGYGLCGCLDPRAHESGCLWGLNRRQRPGTAPSIEARLARIERKVDALLALLAPREGACIICAGPLDKDAVQQHDCRCTRCYRAIGARVGARP